MFRSDIQYGCLQHLEISTGNGRVKHMGGKPKATPTINTDVKQCKEVNKYNADIFLIQANEKCRNHNFCLVLFSM